MSRPKPLYEIGDQLRHKYMTDMPRPMTVMARFYVDVEGWYYEMIAHPTAAYCLVREGALICVEEYDYEIASMAILNDLHLAIEPIEGEDW